MLIFGMSHFSILDIGFFRFFNCLDECSVALQNIKVTAHSSNGAQIGVAFRQNTERVNGNGNGSGHGHGHGHGHGYGVWVIGRSLLHVGALDTSLCALGSVGL